MQSQGKDRPRLDKKLSRGAHNRPNVEMTFQRVPACTQLERLGKSGDKVVVCRLSRSLGRDSLKALSRTSSLLNYRLHSRSRQQRLSSADSPPPWQALLRAIISRFAEWS